MPNLLYYIIFQTELQDFFSDSRAKKGNYEKIYIFSE